MTVLGVAPIKKYRGVKAPGARLGQFGAPGMKPFSPATYDWRAPRRSPDNTASIEAVYALIQHDDLLASTYDTDAHFVAYTLRLRGSALTHFPRVTKEGLEWVRSLGYEVSVETLVADVDHYLPGSPKPIRAPWPSEAVAVASAHRVHQLLRTCAVYITARGLRVIQPLTSSVGPEQAEICVRLFLSRLEEAFSSAGLLNETARTGLVPDRECDDWTRCFRAPHVRRSDPGKAPYTYRSPAVIRVCEPVPPPAGEPVARARRERARPRMPGDVVFAPSPDKAFTSILDSLAHEFAANYQGARHAIGLALAGALLQSHVPREQVPAIVATAARLGGWGDPEHHRGSAIDTVMRWSEGLSVAGLSALPEPVRASISFVLTRARAERDAAPASGVRESLAEVSRRLRAVILEAPIGVTLVRAQCGIGKTHSARSVAVERARRAGVKRNTKSSLAVPTTKLAIQVTADLRAEGVATTRLFGPLSVAGAGACVFRAQAQALAKGGQSVQKILCSRCEHAATCGARGGADEQEDARVFVGPHQLLAELVESAGSEGLVFVDEAPSTLEDVVFPLDALIEAERTIETHVEPVYRDAMAPVLRAVRSWVEIAPVEATGPIGRAFEDLEAVRSIVADLPEVAPLDRHSVIVARSSLPLASRLGSLSEILRAIWGAIVRPRVRATVYDRGGRSLAITAMNRDVENAILLSDRAGVALERRVVIASADAHLREVEYRALAPDLAFHGFSAPDGAPIARTMIVTNGARSALATDDPRPIESAARLVAEWALEVPRASTCGVVTFLRHEQVVLRALRLAAPSVRWETMHYGATRGLDGWKDFDAIATIGDPRPNLDAVARELGGGGAEVEARLTRADEIARSELEQAHGRLRVVHRTRPGRALHVGSLLPLGWPADVEYRRPALGRVRRPVTPGLEALVRDAGGQRAAARATGRSVSTVHRWLEGEGRPQAEDVAALVRAGLERRSAAAAGGVPESPLDNTKALPEHRGTSDQVSCADRVEGEAA